MTFQNHASGFCRAFHDHCLHTSVKNIEALRHEQLEHTQTRGINHAWYSTIHVVGLPHLSNIHMITKCGVWPNHKNHDAQYFC